MKFVINTVWQHSNPIDWEKMQKMMDEALSKADSICSVQWFEIDEMTHGSFATFPSKEAFQNMRATRENQRKEANDRGIKMIYEVYGYVKAEGSS